MKLILFLHARASIQNLLSSKSIWLIQDQSDVSIVFLFCEKNLQLRLCLKPLRWYKKSVTQTDDFDDLGNWIIFPIGEKEFIIFRS